MIHLYDSRKALKVKPPWQEASVLCISSDKQLRT